MVSVNSSEKWQFWVDRGGTFTDIVAKSPQGKIIIDKLLSENPEQYQDAPIQGIRDILGIGKNQPIPTEIIGVVKMGTTVATNALLERKGERVVFVTTKGFKDALRIGYQNRPDLFALQITLPEMLYETVIEVAERYNAQGEELESVNREQVKQDLQLAFARGIRSCAIVFMHSYRYPKHELEVAEIAQEIGFTQISVSHQVSPLIKFVSRGDTTVVDAYLSPILRRYVEQVKNNLYNLADDSYSEQGTTNNQQLTKLMFMQSNGGLVDADLFQGKDSILSGPAGGVVGAVKTCEIAGFKKIIGFDMGGTSTDVSHYQGEYERSFETEVAGVRLRSPMMAIHTVAAGGSSILHFDGNRYRVGPDSAGSNPGAACYGRGGQLTITDCNVMVGKLQPQFFPKVFGKNANLPLDKQIVIEKFKQLVEEINDGRNEEQIASGFLAIAVNNMANAIKKISLQKGYDVSEYTLCCFGGAGGQHACLIADALGMKQIFIHPYAGVLSAYGIGLADIIIIKEKSVEAICNETSLNAIQTIFSELITLAKQELAAQGETDNQKITISQKVHLKYVGTDSSLVVDYGNLNNMKQQFESLHQQRYGFIVTDKNLIIETVSIELICPTYQPEVIEPEPTSIKNIQPQPIDTVKVYMNNSWQDTPVYQREELQSEAIINSPAIIVEATGTNIIEPGWQGKISNSKNLVLSKIFE
ncbi:MAG: hydantoinase/oxoprolinase family protein [Xenococcaceae cyanobacterium MO_207.B15]|nr:hydantoinase/oxoprolinase family protein [Xenococcaceae cyanobacterium MO_207.B15]